jgi:threonine dehydrogenase-like Zn-dependent dehydrogenase
VAAPAAKPQEDAPALVRKRGTVCLFASLPKGRSAITLDSRPIHYGELRIVGSSDSTPRQVARAVEMLAGGTFPADRVITHVLGLDAIARAFELMAKGEALKVVLTRNGDGQA